MSIKLSDMIPLEQRILMGLTVQRIGIDFSDTSGEGATYTLQLVKESGQNFQFQNITFNDGIAPIVDLTIGTLSIIATLVSWKEVVTDIGGKSIYTVVLTQDARTFLSPISVVEAFHIPEDLVLAGATVDDEGLLTKPFLHNDNIYIATTIVEDKIIGPSIQEIFATFKDKVFTMGSSIIFFNFDGLEIDPDNSDLIELRNGSTTLFDIINDYVQKNNFKYNLKFTKITFPKFPQPNPAIDGIEVSFIKSSIIQDGDILINGYLNILDALEVSHGGEIINYEKGFGVAKDFKQSTEFLRSRTFDPETGRTTDVVDTHEFLHAGITDHYNFGQKTPVNMVRGGLTSDFLHFTKGDIHQFWGFKANGVLADGPSEQDLRKMTKILNNEDIIGTDTNLREFMNLWGRQFVVNSTHLTEFLPLTPEQEAAIAKEEQAIVDLIEALLTYFSSLPVRHHGDPGRDIQFLFLDFLDQYSIDHPDIEKQAINYFFGIMFYGTATPGSNPNDYNGIIGISFLSKQLYPANFDSALNNFNENGPYPSVDDILASLINNGELYQSQGYIGLSLISTQISLTETRISRQVPASVRAKVMCFPSIDHPLSGVSKAIANFRSSNGQWPSYVKLPKLPLDTKDTVYEWGSKIISTINHARVTSVDPKTKFKTEADYVRVDVKQYNNFYIITLPGQMLQIKTVTSKSTDNPNGTQKIELEIIEMLSDAFVATEDTRKPYGPFVIAHGELLDENSKEFLSIISDSSKYKITNIINDKLIPESFNKSGNLTKLESLEVMKDFIRRNLNSLDKRLVWSHRFGTLTVAGFPVKEAFDLVFYPDGTTITRLSINFDIGGIKTTYYVDSPDREDIIDPEKVIPVPDVPKNEEVKMDEPKLESDPKQNTLSDEELKYIYRKPEGGQGVIVGVEIGGPFYTVRRLNYADIDPQTFAGGLNITESYFSAEWKHVRNFAEPDGSPGYLLPGTKVHVIIFSDSVLGPFVPYIEQSPQVFMPPLDDQEEEK